MTRANQGKTVLAAFGDFSLFSFELLAYICNKSNTLNRLRTISFYLVAAYCLQLAVSSCTPIDLYEKSVRVPGHAWQSSFKPSFTFTIQDTSSLYRLFLVLRHNGKYNFNNIWLNISIKTPGTDTLKTFKTESILATNEDGWLASGMDDIYEHRIELNDALAENEISLHHAGDYVFTLEQIMREDPLHNIYNIGLRIEKKE